MVATFVLHPIKVLAIWVSILFVLVISLNNARPVRAAVSLSTTTPYTQDFNSLGTSAIAELPTDWRVSRDDANCRTVGKYSDAGSSTQRTGGNSLPDGATAGIYNFGAGNFDVATDRAVGFFS